MKIIEFDASKARTHSPAAIMKNISEIDIDSIKEIMVAFQFKDGSHEFAWTDMPSSMQLFILEGFKQKIVRNVFEGE